MTIIYVKPFSSNTGTSRTDGRTDRRTDRQTDRFAISISRVSVLTRDHPDTTIIARFSKVNSLDISLIFIDRLTYHLREDSRWMVTDATKCDHSFSLLLISFRPIISSFSQNYLQTTSSYNSVFPPSPLYLISSLINQRLVALSVSLTLTLLLTTRDQIFSTWSLVLDQFCFCYISGA